MNRFPTGEEKELELWCRKCKAFTDEKHGCKDCKKCGTDTKCKHCKGDIAIRNPKGFCDHLYYPENCEVCRRDTKMKPDWEKEFDSNFVGPESRYGGDGKKFSDWLTEENGLKIKQFIRNLLAKQEEQHKKEVRKAETTIFKQATEILKLKQQHRAELEGLKMKTWEYKPNLATDPTPNLPGHEGNTKLFSTIEGYNQAVNKFNQAVTNLLDKGEEI